jgi:hypothetical protein
MEANSGSDEVWNINYGKKLKQWSNEAFNIGKEIEVMKRLTLDRIVSSLLLPSFDSDNVCASLKLVFTYICNYFFLIFGAVFSNCRKFVNWRWHTFLAWFFSLLQYLTSCK